MRLRPIAISDDDSMSVLISIAYRSMRRGKRPWIIKADIDGAYYVCIPDDEGVVEAPPVSWKINFCHETDHFHPSKFYITVGIGVPLIQEIP